MTEEGNGEWYEVTALVRDGTFEPTLQERELICVKGRIDNLTVVQFSSHGLTPEAVRQSIEAIKVMLQEVGIEEAVIVPDGVEMMRLRKLDPDRARALDLAKKNPPGGVH